MGLSAIFVSRSAHSFTLEVIALVLLGVSSGLFIVPLNAYLQQRSENEEKGRMIATNNFYNTLGLLLASAVLWGLHDKLHFAPEKLILWCGLVTLVATVFLIRVVPEFLMRFILWMTMHTIYRMKIIGRENIPLRGAALLVSNHVTHLDGFFIAACMQRFVRFMVWKVFCDMKVLGALLRFSKAIPAGTTGPRDVVASIRAAREKLKEGHVVCIFAEGVDQPHRQSAAVQARPGKDCRRPGCSDHSSASGRPVGQRVQLRRRPVFLEMAEAFSFPHDGFVRRADAL